MIKFIIIRLILVALFCNAFLPVHSQDNISDCKKFLKSYFSQMARYDVPEGKEVYYLNMDVVMEYDRSKVPPDMVIHKSHNEVFTGKDEYFFKSSEIIMYMSKNLTYIVLQKDKKIFFDDGNADIYPEGGLSYQVRVQDSLLKNSNVVGCTEEKIGGEKYKDILIVPTVSVSKKSHLKQMSYRFRKKDNSIYRVINIYNAGNVLKKQTAIYNKIDFKYKADITEMAFDQLFNKDKSLKSKYRKYQLIDRRND